MNDLDKKSKIKMQKGDYRKYVWDAITEIGVEEHHFHNLESKYRKLASTWLLAYFGAIGFILATDVIIIKELFVNRISIDAIGIILL